MASQHLSRREDDRDSPGGKRCRVWGGEVEDKDSQALGMDWTGLGVFRFQQCSLVPSLARDILEKERAPPSGLLVAKCGVIINKGGNQRVKRMS